MRMPKADFMLAVAVLFGVTMDQLIPHSGNEFNEPQRRKGRKVRTSGQRFGQFFSFFIRTWYDAG